MGAADGSARSVIRNDRTGGTITLKDINTSLIKLFLSFAKMGVMTFGGGYAMLPILQREVVEKNHWATEEELMDYFAIGQCTPGIIAVNTATFIGHKQRGVLGAIVATLGVAIPPPIANSPVLKNSKNNFM